LLNILARTGAKPNETYEIGIALAVRLRHQRVYAVDDHSADTVQAQAGAGLEPFLEAHWRDSDYTLKEAIGRMEAALISPDDLLGYYRVINSPATQRDAVKGDYHRAMNLPSPENYGRKYLAWWEVRNLRKVVMIAWSPTPSTVECASFGRVGISLTTLRYFHFATVFWLIP
jgi:hypothetical protein